MRTRPSNRDERRESRGVKVAKILIAEDSPTAAEMLRRTIVPLGHEVVLANDGCFTPSLLPFNLGSLHPAESGAADDFFLPLAEVELQYIARVYQAVNGDRGKTARILGISPKTLQRKLQRMKVDDR